MTDRKKLISITQYSDHKGFYNDDDFTTTLWNIIYTEFFEYPNDEEFPYISAHALLRGACNIFGLALNKVLNYNIYIIQGNDKKGFHVFGQFYKNRKWYYVDARGITSSFDEFMLVAREFISDEYTIRQVTEEDIQDWKDDVYNDEGLAFAEAVIEKYKECYILSVE